MSSKRSKDFDLRTAILSVSFTPAQRDLPTLLQLLGDADEATAKASEQTLLRLGKAVSGSVLHELTQAPSPTIRSRLIRLLGRLARTDASLRGPLLALADDANEPARRHAVVALGKLASGQDREIEDTLLRAWQSAVKPELHRAIVAALGKVGGERTAALLAQLATKDPELARLAGQAVLVVGRNASADQPSVIDAAIAPDDPTPLLFHCRSGLEQLLMEELGASWSSQMVRPGLIRAMLRGPLSEVFWSRTWLAFGFPLMVARAAGESTSQVVTRMLTSPAARKILHTWTQGKIRYRLAWAGGEKRSGERWNLIKEIAQRDPSLINDPSQRAWDILVSEKPRTVELEFRPRLDDPRFVYRVATLPASSHPTVAAALARLGGVEADDVVWDPFAGAACELCERARLGPYAALHGSDISPEALAAARLNLTAAGISDCSLHEGDALQVRPEGLTLVVTNPPLGHRLLSQETELRSLYERLLRHVAGLLRPRGRLVWTTPFAEYTTACATQLGFQLEWHSTLDMGGFHVELQRLRKIT